MAASRDEENLYQRLGVAQDATAEQIENALKDKYASVEKLREQALVNEDLMREKVAEAQNNYAELEKLVQFHLLNPANRKKYDDNLSSTASNAPNANAEKGKESTPWFPGIDMERHPAIPNPIIALLMIFAATGKKTGRTPLGLLRWANERYGICPGLKELAEKLGKIFERSNDPNASQHSAGSAPATLTLEQEFSEERRMVEIITRGYSNEEDAAQLRNLLKHLFKDKNEQEIDGLLKDLQNYEATESALAEISQLRAEMESAIATQQTLENNPDVIPAAYSSSDPFAPLGGLLQAAERFTPVMERDIEMQKRQPAASFGEGGGGSFGEDDKDKLSPSTTPRLRPPGSSS